MVCHFNNFIIFVTKIINCKDIMADKSKGPAPSPVASLTRLGRQVSDATIFMHQAIARNAGLTGTDHKYLRIVLESERITAGELARQTGLTTGAVTGLIDRLEKKELVRRELDQRDRRKVWIVPRRENADRLFENSHLDLREQVARLIATFNAEEIRAIERYLTASVGIMNQITRKLNNQ